MIKSNNLVKYVKGYKMSSGLFILMDGEECFKQCINKGVYGFLMPPVFEDEDTGIKSDFTIGESSKKRYF